MAEVYRKMLSDDESPAKCREARRRRMVMRRSSSAGATEQSSLAENENILPKRPEKRPDSSERSDEGKRNRTSKIVESPSSLPSSSSSSSQSSPRGGAEVPASVPSITLGHNLAKDLVPIFGSISVLGRSREMEDAISVHTDFCRPEISDRRPLHFFAVYDGHGGSHVATVCKERMHVLLKEELMRLASNSGDGGSSSATQQEESQEERWRSVMGRCFERMDEVALSSCACGGVTNPCRCEQAGGTSEIVGSTAVVAVLTPDKIVVASCGDSRAVLSRGGRAIPLSTDHKPDRPDELRRIEAAGGRVIYLNGARVLGILAMSRALGDKYLKPIVISEPELTITERTPEDECLILASDGLWDVISNDLACEVAHKCLYEGSPAARILNAEPPDRDTTATEQIDQSRCSIAAALLTRLALGRKSSDNISVIVVDLKRG
ncbi:probable protein phosphatase 2C 75 [Macadamia integrifolia]|uniref:probable protein phosphatase 2C 75 n=1 Tax=Macadamia integrifolia TaxID=60698 RepID=UPI001C4F30C4|nr:probable protein phosphatase 2C 75 [Macadamia integrifolia]